MTCGGEGGAVGSFDQARVRRVFNLANHARGEQFHTGMGTAEPYRAVVHDEIGFNYRQSEILSAIARVQLRMLPDWLALRRQWVDLYRAQITDAGLPVHLPVERPWAEHSYVRFEVRVPRRDAIRAYLKRQGVGTSVHYPTPIHLDHPYRDIVKMPEGSLPICERLAQEILTLPLYPQMSEDDVTYVVDHLKAFFSRRAAATA
jgi:dTDP-4-amino-4,6-dideoxygalactose transaminase